MVLSRFEAGGIGPYHVLHLDPFAFVMKPEDERMRGLHRELIGECDERVQLHGPAAASVFFTWGSNNAAAKAGHLNGGYGGGHDNGYQALVAVAHRDQRIVITWCRGLHFSLLCIVPTDAKERVARAVATEVAWLKPLMRIIEVDHGGA